MSENILEPIIHATLCRSVKAIILKFSNQPFLNEMISFVFIKWESDDITELNLFSLA